MNNDLDIPQEISWKAPSHKLHQRPSAWYLVFGLVSLGLIVFAVLSHSIITMITFVLMIMVVLIFSIQQPRTITCKLTKSGVTIGRVSYPYKIIKTFWIVYTPPDVKTLNFETTAYINNEVIMELASQDPTTVKLFLSQYLIEDLQREESLPDTLARKLKI